MDAGITAVLGALVGSLATIIAAFAAGFAQREGARIAARSAFQKDQRQPRYIAYHKLLNHGVNLVRVLQTRTGDANVLSLVRQDVEEIEKAWIEIGLLGPASVLPARSQVHRCALEIQRMVVENGPTEAIPGAALEALMESIDKFSVVAQAVIESNGAE